MASAPQDHTPSSLRLILGLKLRQFRARRGFGLKDLAERSGLSVSYLSEIETGRKYPKTEKLLLLGDDRHGAEAASAHIGGRGMRCGRGRRDIGRRRRGGAGKHDGEQQGEGRQHVGRPSHICIEPCHGPGRLSLTDDRLHIGPNSGN